jgi:hypothetical protein
VAKSSLVQISSVYLIANGVEFWHIIEECALSVGIC